LRKFSAEVAKVRAGMSNPPAIDIARKCDEPVKANDVPKRGWKSRSGGPAAWLT